MTTRQPRSRLPIPVTGSHQRRQPLSLGPKENTAVPLLGIYGIRSSQSGHGTVLQCLARADGVCQWKLVRAGPLEAGLEQTRELGDIGMSLAGIDGAECEQGNPGTLLSAGRLATTTPAGSPTVEACSLLRRSVLPKRWQAGRRRRRHSPLRLCGSAATRVPVSAGSIPDPVALISPTTSPADVGRKYMEPGLVSRRILTSTWLTSTASTRMSTCPGGDREPRS
jgi:hypothetical protein